MPIIPVQLLCRLADGQQYEDKGVIAKEEKMSKQKLLTHITYYTLERTTFKSHAYTYDTQKSGASIVKRWALVGRRLNNGLRLPPF